MISFTKKVGLSSSFWLKKFGREFFLIDTHYHNIVFEPYILTKEEFLLVKELDGSKTIESIIARKKLKNFDFFNLLDNKKALTYGKKRDIIVFDNKRGLYDVHFEFEAKCNYFCKHCYQEKYISNVESLSLGDIKKLAKQFNNVGVIKVALSGGEPFLRKDLKKICYIFHNNGIKVDCIFTNGSLIKKSDIKWLAKEAIQIFISLDGLSLGNGVIRNIPQHLRKSSFKNILEIIKRLTEGGVIVKVNTIIHKHNIQEISQMYNLFKKIGVLVWRLTISKEVGRYKNNKDSLSITKSELNKVIRQLLKSFIRDIKKCKNGIIIPFDLKIANIFKSEMLVKPLVGYSKTDSSCDYQKERITIKSNGDVVPCGLLVDQVFGNIKKEYLGNIIKNKNLKYIKNIPIVKIHECNKCEYSYVCGGGCRVNSLSEFGDLFHKDSHACLCMNLLFGEVKKILLKNNYRFNFEKNDSRKIEKTGTVYIADTDYYF